MQHESPLCHTYVILVYDRTIGLDVRVPLCSGVIRWGAGVSLSESKTRKIPLVASVNPKEKKNFVLCIGKHWYIHWYILVYSRTRPR